MKSLFSIVALLMLMLAPVLTGMPPHESAFLSACLVVFTGAITMEQAYREIDWRVVFLLALMIPLGHAVEQVATAGTLVPLMRGVADSVSPIVLAAFFLAAGSVISQTIDNSVGVIFLGPVALEVAKYTHSSPTGFLIALTLGSSLSFMLPTSCRSNLIVTGAGGYRARDFIRIGVPFTLVTGLALLAALAWRDF
jgi:di/tricarboxylate transporter